MRSLLFNAWDPKTKIMVHDTGIPHTGYRGGGDLVNHVWLESTGLHDKNGEQIFEGDIVLLQIRWLAKEDPRSKDEFVHAAVVHEQYDDGENYGDEHHLGWIVKWKGKYYECRRTLPDVAANCERVGNIYEHPELLA